LKTNKNLKSKKMKQLFLLLVITVLVTSCNVTKIAKSIEPNVAVNDFSLAANQIDTLTGSYATIDRDLFLYTGAFFERKDSIAGGVIYQKETLDGDLLIARERIFRIDKKGKRIKDKKGNFISDPFWVEIGNCVPSDSGESTYEKIPIIIDGGDTFMFIPQPLQGSGSSQPRARTGNISLRGTVRQENDRSFQQKNNDNLNYRYTLSLLVCGSNCDQQQIYDNGFMIENGSRRIYMNYRGTKYYITISLNNREWYVPAQSAGVSLSGIYRERELVDKRQQEFSRSKQLGQ
jgi:hypothetical protein